MSHIQITGNSWHEICMKLRHNVTLKYLFVCLCWFLHPIVKDFSVISKRKLCILSLNQYRVSDEILCLDPASMLCLLPLILVYFFFFIFFYFFSFSLCPFQDYFSSYETGQSVGGAKTGGPGEKPPDTPASRTACLTCGLSGARTHTRHSGEMIE